MGRKATDSVTEHRITFGDLERKQIQAVIDTQKANVAVDGVTATLQAAGSALAGGGMLWAAIGLVAWFGGGAILDAANDTRKKAWAWINDEIAKPFVDWVGEDSLVFDADKWREINRQDQIRMELAQADLDRYGNPASQYYDESRIAAAHAALLHAIEIRDLNNQLEFEERQRVRRVYSDWGYEEVYSPNEIALQLAHEEALRVWVEGGSVGDPPTLDLSRANN
jgi:hypothetical protein